MKRTLSFVVAALLATNVLAQNDPSSAISAARQAISDRQYAKAVETLQAAFPAARSIMDERQRGQATAALHFYSALAYSAMGKADDARSHLQEFFRLNPNANTLDPSKYDKKFVKLFNETREKSRDDAAGRFDLIYPGYNASVRVLPRQVPFAKWNETPEFVLLATGEEKKAWSALADDAAREAFVTQFWAKRDRNAATPDNEYKAEFDRRVAFADEKFGGDRGRGALTDRGRVFVLFGVPQSISVKPLTGREGGEVRSQQQISAGGILNASPGAAAANAAASANSSTADAVAQKGLVERWTYSYEQLPPSVPKTGVSFKFVTEDGYGDHVLQRESIVLKAMQDAAG